MENKKHILAVTGVIRNDNKFLIIKRSNKEVAFPGKWAFPGGKAERGENIMQTLTREIEEEVGLQIDNSKEYLKDYTFERPDGHNVIGLVFLVSAKSKDVILSNDFEDYKWIKHEELKDYNHIPGMEKEVEAAFTNLRL